MKRWILFGAILLALLLIAGAGYLGWRTTRPPAQPGADGLDAPPTVRVTRGDVLQTVIAPGTLADTHTAVVRARLAGEVNGNTGERQVNLSHAGPEVEVVYSRDTVLYRDETEIPEVEPGKMKSGELVIQQAIVPAESLDEIAPNTELQVWGRKRGDRIVAEVIVYRIVDGF